MMKLIIYIILSLFTISFASERSNQSEGLPDFDKLWDYNNPSETRDTQLSKDTRLSNNEPDRLERLKKLGNVK